jgi:hypothetical protein
MENLERDKIPFIRATDIFHLLLHLHYLHFLDSYFRLSINFPRKMIAHKSKSIKSLLINCQIAHRLPDSARSRATAFRGNVENTVNRESPLILWMHRTIHVSMHSRVHRQRPMPAAIYKILASWRFSKATKSTPCARAQALPVSTSKVSP